MTLESLDSIMKNIGSVIDKRADAAPTPVCAHGVGRRLTCAQCDAIWAEESRKRELAIETRSIPARYHWSAPESPELQKRITGHDSTKDSLESICEAASAVFTGPAGAGKTSLACAALRLAKRQGAMVLFEHSYKLANARALHKLGDGEPALVDRAMSCQLLLIDDLGNERRTELSAVSDVIFERHAEERCTWVTTAFSPSEIAAKYGDGISRRVFEGAKVVRLGKK